MGEGGVQGGYGGAMGVVCVWGGGSCGAMGVHGGM